MNLNIVPTPPEIPPVGVPGKLGSSFRVSLVISLCWNVPFKLKSHLKLSFITGIVLIEISNPRESISPILVVKAFSRFEPAGRGIKFNKSLVFLI